MSQFAINRKQNWSVAGIMARAAMSVMLIMVGFTGFSKEYRVNTNASTIEWEAKKVTGKHVGTIAFSEGTLQVDKKKVTGGQLSVDMNTIVNTDLTDAGYNQKLIGHLKSDDFFGVAKFPQSVLEVKSVVTKSGSIQHIVADLTIKGITAPVEFDAEVSEVSGEIIATGTIAVDRTKYGIKYGSGSFFQGLGDKMIYDEFTLKFKLVAAVK